MKNFIKIFISMILVTFISIISFNFSTQEVKADENSFEFKFTGAVQQFVAPVDGIYTLELWGAEGGGSRLSGDTQSGLGGLGGYSKGEITLNKGNVLYLYIGGKGQSAKGSSSANNPREILGGWNGGGMVYSTNSFAHGGGGATDIRSGGYELANRIIVAGGGGGAGIKTVDNLGRLICIGNGGEGGGLAGGDGSADSNKPAAKGGTQTVGFVLGNGENSGKASNEYGGGGGGGYFGGKRWTNSPGGGGSGYIDSSKISNGETKAGLRQNDGMVKITLKYFSQIDIKTPIDNLTLGLNDYLYIEGKVSSTKSITTIMYNIDGKNENLIGKYGIETGVTQSFDKAIDVSGIASGIHRLNIWSYTEDGRIKSEVKSINFNIGSKLDDKILGLNIKAPNNNNFYKTGEFIVLEGNVSSPNKNDMLTVKYRIDNNEVQTINGSSISEEKFIKTKVDTASLNDGAHTLTAWVVDNFGRSSKETVTNFYIDKNLIVPESPRVTVNEDGTITISPVSIKDGNTYSFYEKENYLGDSKNTYIHKNILPNSRYEYRYKIINGVTNKLESTYSKATLGYTNANKPKINVLQDMLLKNGAILKIEDGNPGYTKYLVTIGDKYLNSNGELVDAASWITIPNKEIRMLGLQLNEVYNISAKAINEENKETDSSDIVKYEIKQTLPQKIEESEIKKKLTATSISLDFKVNRNNIGYVSVGYEVEVDGEIKKAGFDGKYIHKALKPDTQHAYRVRQLSTNGISGPWSEIITLKTTTDVPSIIDSQSIQEIKGKDSLFITWKEDENAEGYVVEFNGKEIYRGSNNSFIQYGLKPSTQYSFRVKGYNSIGEGQWRNIDTGTVLLDTPNNINVIQGEDSIKLSWDKVESATLYEIEVDKTIIATVKDLSYEHFNLTSESIKKYRIRAKNLQGFGEWSNEILGEVLPTRPKKVEEVTATASKDSITLTWQEIVGAIGYDVELDGILIDNDNNKQYIHEGLKPYTVHKYRVRSKNEAIESEWSDYLTVRTLPENILPPQNITIKNTNNTAVIAWDNIDGALSYDIEIVGDNEKKEIKNINKNTYTHRRAKVGQEYVYRIKSRNILGESEYSGQIINNAIKANCKIGKDIDLGLTASDIVDFSKYILVVNYDKDVLEVEDLSTFTKEVEVKEGLIKDTGITIKEFKEGKIVFTVDKKIELGQSYTGVINSIKFKAKVAGGSNITYTVISQN